MKEERDQVKKRTGKNENTERQRKGLNGFALLNPKNLEKEVHVYGYNFSWKSHLLVMVCSLFGISAIGVLFQLKPGYFVAIVMAVIVVLPILIRDTYKRMFEQKRFSDVVTYMEQMLYSFQKSGKVMVALTETREMFEDGNMRDVITQALDYLNTGRAETEKGVLREALEIIEGSYECAKLHAVHELLISSEEYGGESSSSVLLILSDLDLFKRRGYSLQLKKKTSHTDNIISIVVATILCAVALYVLDAMRTMFPGAEAVETSIFQLGIIQVTSMAFIFFMLFVLVKSQRSLTSDWLQEEQLHDRQHILDSYEAVMNYDEGKEKKKSFLYAAPFLVIALLAFVFRRLILGIVLLLVGAFMLLQHRVGYNLARKDVNQELYIAFPQWLMEIALLLQNNNVQVSIARSIPGAPPVLQKELQLLMERIRQEPDKLKSYTDFCKDFDIPEATSCMKMLHAMSESGTGDAKEQVKDLIMRVQEMQNAADDIRDKNIAFKAKMIFMYPVGGATVKLLVDLMVGVVYMMSMLGSMGGV